MGILTGKITLGANKYNKIYSDTGNELCSKQGAIYRAFYSENEFNKDDFTEISSGNGLYYFQPMFTFKYQEQAVATDNSNISTGIQFTLSSLGITDDLAISAITIQIREDNTYSGIYKLAIFDQDNNLVTSSGSALVEASFSNIPFKFVFDDLQVLRANKKYYLYTTNSYGEFNTFGFRVTNISVNANYNFVQNNSYKPLLSIDFVDSKNYILEKEPTQTKEHFEISEWGQDVNAQSNWSGYPIKFYPKAFGLKYNRIKINSISLKSGKNNFTGMNLDLSVNLFNNGTNKEFIDKSNENIEITAKDQILTFTFNDLYVNSNKLYIIEFGNKNPILQATSSDRKNPNIRIFYKNPESDCQQPIISVDYEYDIQDIFINNSFNKEVSSVVEKYLAGFEIPDPGLDEERVVELVNDQLDERIINVSQDDFKTLVDNNNVQEKTAYLISTDNFSLYGDRITELGDPINETDAVNLKTLNNAITNFITDNYLSSQISNFITDSYLSSQISNFITDSYLSSQISNFITDSYLSSQISDFITDSYLSSQISDFVTSNYVKSEIEKIEFPTGIGLQWVGTYENNDSLKTTTLSNGNLIMSSGKKEQISTSTETNEQITIPKQGFYSYDGEYKLSGVDSTFYGNIDNYGDYDIIPKNIILGLLSSNLVRTSAIYTTGTSATGVKFDDNTIPSTKFMSAYVTSVLNDIASSLEGLL